VLIDIAEGDPRFAQRSAQLVDRRRRSGIVIAPLSYVELAPLFNGIAEAQNEFLEAIGVHWTVAWTWPDTIAAHQAWHRYIAQRRRGSISKRPVADVLIGAFACRFEGLLTRNARDFRGLFPDLRLEEP
jgi:predicted nucleic acid-binding protein